MHIISELVKKFRLHKISYLRARCSKGLKVTLNFLRLFQQEYENSWNIYIYIYIYGKQLLI